MVAYAITAILIQSISEYKNSQTAFSGMRVFIQYGVHIPYIVIYTI